MIRRQVIRLDYGCITPVRAREPYLPAARGMRQRRSMLTQELQELDLAGRRQRRLRFIEDVDPLPAAAHFQETQESLAVRVGQEVRGRCMHGRRRSCLPITAMPAASSVATVS